MTIAQLRASLVLDEWYIWAFMGVDADTGEVVDNDKFVRAMRDTTAYGGSLPTAWVA